MANTEPAPVLRFGPFEADLGNRQLFKNGIPVSLRGQPFDVLALLLEHPGQLVTREQLRDRLWPSGTIVEFDHSIHGAVTKLRDVLGQHADHPRFIETVPRHGYRFIAPVSIAAPSAPKPGTNFGSALPATSGIDTVSQRSGFEPAQIEAVETDLAIKPAPPGGPRAQWANYGKAQRLTRAVGVFAIAALAVAVAYVVADKFWISRRSAVVQSVPQRAQEVPATATAPTSAPAFRPPPRSIAVLPFVNISGDKAQEYFSDGLTEELLSSLTRVSLLQVAAQTSSFSFKGKDVDVGTIARKLNVGTVLEGSVRQSGRRVRITAQLIDATTGFHLWSQTYDRDIGEVLSLQTEIANAVASALTVTLLADTPGEILRADTAGKIALGGTKNPAAFDAYLRGLKGYSALHNRDALQSAIDAYTEAVRLDSNYALAFAGRAMALCEYTDSWGSGASKPAAYGRALRDARRAIALAPTLGEAHLALARVFESSLDFQQAAEEYASALGLVPGNAAVLQAYGAFAVFMGHVEPGLTALSRAVVLDPLSPSSHYWLGEARWIARRYSEAATAFDEVISLDPNSHRAYGFRGFAYYGLGDLQRALVSCAPARSWTRYVCLALTYQKLGKRAEAEAMLAEYQAGAGAAAAYQYAEIYAQWGNVAKAIEWLDTAVRMHDPGLGWLKGDPLLDPLRNEPRFQAIERALKFPD
jgi:TolB-like protein/DNA-binding winged helix-turn-helix (wHTH) protein/tetratricopeptide (TPR) repeat protein